MQRTYSTRGTLIVADMWGVDIKLLNNLDFLKENMVRIAKEAGATVLDVVGRAFEPQSTTVMVLLFESHFINTLRDIEVGYMIC